MWNDCGFWVKIKVKYYERIPKRLGEFKGETYDYGLGTLGYNLTRG